MARSRQSEEQRVLEYFESAELSKAEVVFDFVKQTMKRRLEPTKAEAPVRRKKRTAKKQQPEVAEAAAE